MLSCFNPKHLALASLLLAAAAARGATAAAAGADAGAPPPPAAAGASVGDVAVSRVTFSPLQDSLYTKSNWMLVAVEFTGRTTKSVINDVTVSLALGWSNPSATPPVDLPLSASIKLIGIFGNKPYVVFFFVPPETLARSAKGQPYDASRAPDFYAVELKIGENALPLSQNNYSTKLTPTSAKSFSSLAENSKGLMYSQVSVPFYIMNQALQKVSSNSLANPVSSDSGH
jgi:hypothetical protein